MAGKISRTGTLALKAASERRSTKRVAQRAAREAKERKLTVGAQFKVRAFSIRISICLFGYI